MPGDGPGEPCDPPGEWHPDVRRELLPGRSEAALSRASLVCAVVGMGAAAVVVALLAVSPALWVAALWPSAVAVLGVTSGGVLDAAAAHRRAREARAGYTTVAGETGDLDYVDARTSRLVRRADEVLTTYEVQGRLRLVRAAAR